MKKSLSLLVAFCVVVSMFASVAYGAEAAQPSTQDKYDALAEQGIFTGYPDGSAGLDKNMTRAQFAVVLKRVNGLTNDAAASKYVDVPAKHWAIGEIGAVTKASLMNGVGANKFDPNGNVTIEALATTLVRALDLEPVEDAEVPGASAWAAGYVQAALDAHIIPASSNYKAAAKRGQLVDATYAFVGGVVSVQSAVAVDAKTVKVTFSDDQVVTKELSEALKPGVATKVTVEYNGKSYEVEVTLGVVAAEAKAVGAKKVEVKFNQGVDASKVTFSVYNPTNVPVNVAKVANSDDKTTYTLELASAIVKGEYTVKVNGLDQEVSAKFTAADETVEKIEFLSDKAALDRNNKKVVTAGVKISNQYGEDITSAKVGGVTFTASAGAVTQNGTSALTITNTADYTLDSKIVVTALDVASTKFASATLTVSDQARVSEVSVSKLYNADSTAVLGVGSSYGDFKLVVEAKDQYGNVITDEQTLEEDLFVTDSNPYVLKHAERTVGTRVYADFVKTTIDGKTVTILPLANGTSSPKAAGTSKLTFLTPYSSKTASFDVTVKDAVKADKLTLTAPALAVAGEKVEIPFSAVDQFGAAITKASDLNAAGSLLSLSSTKGTIAIEQDYVKGTPKLVLDATTVTEKTPVTVVAISSTGNQQIITFNLVDAAVGSVITATKDFTKDFMTTATGTLANSNLVVKDQYGRDFTTNSNYRVVVKSSDASKVALSGSVISVTDGTYQIDASNSAGIAAGSSKGSATLTLTLQKLDAGTFKDVSGSTLTLNSKVVEKADVASYEIADVATLYSPASANTAYSKALTVNGVLADGSKVAVPASYYNVNVTGSGVDTTTVAGKLTAYGSAGFDSSNNKEVKVTAVVDGANGAVLVNKQVKVSTNAPATAKLEVVKSGSVASLVDTNVISATAANVNNNTNFYTLVGDAVKSTDQYGVELTSSTAPTAEIFNSTNTYVTNLPSGKTLATVEAGQSFNVTVVVNGVSVTFKVIVTA